MSHDPRLHRVHTHAELDVAVRSLHNVGGIYEAVAEIVEIRERPRCTGAPTGVSPPWVN